MTWLAALLGAGFGAGLLAVIVGLRGVPARPPRPPLWQRVERPLLRAALAAAAALVAGLATGWPVGALLAAMLGAAAPDLLAATSTRKQAIARIEAVAAWTEMLRDTLAGAAGIEQAIASTAPVAPAPIRGEVLALAARLEHQRLPAALRAFADDVADPTCDLAVAALLLGSQRRAQRLGELLGTLAHAAREHATMRLRVEASRARTRTSTRVVVGTTIAMAAGLVAFNRAFLDPYNTAPGQLALAAVGALFAAGFWWLARLARPAAPDRLLPPPSAQAGGP